MPLRKAIEDVRQALERSLASSDRASLTTGKNLPAQARTQTN
jgi:hypothetical protein